MSERQASFLNCMEMISVLCCHMRRRCMLCTDRTATVKCMLRSVAMPAVLVRWCINVGLKGKRIGYAGEFGKVCILRVVLRLLSGRAASSARAWSCWPAVDMTGKTAGMPAALAKSRINVWEWYPAC